LHRNVLKFGTSRSSRTLQQSLICHPKNIESLRHTTKISALAFDTETEKDDGVSGGGVVAGGEAELRLWSEVDVDVVAERGAGSEGSDSRRYGGLPGRSESE
jgi:hypothetical protein